jgi:uncharacterized protein with beta-barrel porin domain
VITSGISNSGTITNAGPRGHGIEVNFNVAIFAGGISNSGSISSNHTGIVVFGSTFSGGITNSGTVSSGAAEGISIFGTFSGGISNGGIISGSIAGIAVQGNFSGGITNSGTITGGTSSIFMRGIFSGGITNSGAMQNIILDSPLTFSGGISNSGTIALGIAVFTDTFSGGISNSGTISGGAVTDAVSLRFGSFAGGITNTGLISGLVGISVGNVAAFDGHIVNAGTITGSTAAIDLTQAPSALTIDQTAGLIQGAINLSSHGDTLNVAGGTITGNIVGQNHGDTINFALGSGTFTYDSAFGFSGISQVNVNSGAVILNGTNSATATDINGGTLAGTGTLTSLLTVHSGGTFAPGTPGAPGTAMTLTGNLAFQPGATYLVQLNPSMTTLANVSGTAALAGTVQAAFAPGSYLARNYTILTSSGLGGTTFNSLTTSNLPAGFAASLSYTSTNVILNLTAQLGGPSSLPTGSLSGNQLNVANALNTFFNNGGTLTPGFLSVFGFTGGNLGNALTLLSGEAATGGQQGAFQLMREFLELMLDDYVDGRGGIGGADGRASNFAPERPGMPEEITLAYANALKAPVYKAIPFEQRWSVWGSAYGGYNKTSGDPLVVGSHDLTARTGGFAAGMDYRVAPNTVLGFALAGGGTNWALAQGLGGGRSDAFQAGVYGTTRWGPAYVAASLAFTDHWMSTDRFAVAGDHLTAAFNAQSVGARVESGWRFATPVGGITPYAALTAQSFRTPSYNETDVNGGGFGLSYMARSASDTRSELGARFDKKMMLDPTTVLALRARLAWAHDWISDPTLAAVFQALPGASFIVNGATPAKNSALASAGAELRLANGVSLLGKLDGEFAQHSSTYAGTGTVRYTW